MNIRPFIIQRNDPFSLDYSMCIHYNAKKDVAICVRGVLRLYAVMTVANGNIFIVFLGPTHTWQQQLCAEDILPSIGCNTVP